MLNTQAMHDRDSFIEAHGPYVLVDNTFLFADGAMVEDNPLGQLLEPSSDKFQRAQDIAKYWHMVTMADEARFLSYKSFLESLAGRKGATGGHGVPGVVTEEEQLDHLKMLRTQCKRSRAKFYKSKRDVKAATPFWIEEREAQEIEEQRQKQEFLQRVDSIEL